MPAVAEPHHVYCVCDSDNIELQMSQSRPCCENLVLTARHCVASMQVNWLAAESSCLLTQQGQLGCLALVCCGWVLNDMMHIH